MAITNIVPQTFTFRDVKGHIARVRFLIGYDSAALDDAAVTADAVLSGIMAVCGGNLTQVSGVGPFNFRNPSGAYPTPAGGERYIAAEDKIRLTYLCAPGGITAGGSVHRMELPAPLGAQFDSDDRTWTVAGQTAFATALKTITGSALVVDSGGQPVDHVLGGKRVERPIQRKLTIYSKTPTLSQWEI